MESRQNESIDPPGSSSFTTTTILGPTATATTTYTSEQGVLVTHHGPHSTTITAPTVTTTQVTPTRTLSPSSSSKRSRSGSIQLRKPPSKAVAKPQQSTSNDDWQANKKKSSSEPQPPVTVMLQESSLQRNTNLQPLYEEGSRLSNLAPMQGPPPSQGSITRQALSRQSSAISIRRRDHAQSQPQPQSTMPYNVVELLDVIDPEVSMLTTLNNVQNSLFLPNLPWLYNRRATYDLPQSDSDSESQARRDIQLMPEITQQGEAEQAARQPLTRMHTIDSILTSMDDGQGHHYAVLPHGASLAGWNDEEKAALDDHVRHLLHSKRAKLKRTMRGFGKYIRNPLGFLVTLYFFLITFWGAAWVLFLIGWIYVTDRQDYFVEICDQILTALFCVVGITMFPFRLVDTYHMIFVAHYARKTWRLRKQRDLPDLVDHNDLPSVPATQAWDTGEAEPGGMEVPVLTAEEQKKLVHHQSALAKSHTFYRPHETYTHNAFSIKLLLVIVILLDCHSVLQCSLGGTTWGIYYKRRPKALTAVILSFSLTCNITAGILISRGDKRSRKKLIVEQIMRQELTEEALKHISKERGLKAEGLKSKEEKEQEQKEMGQKKKSPLDTILHRG